MTTESGPDSTFVAAALARGAPGTGLIHVPLPEAELLAAGPFDPDESSLAALLQDRYPDALAVTKVCNDHGVTPLQAAAERSQRSGYPVYNPANAVSSRRGVRRWAISTRHGCCSPCSNGKCGSAHWGLS